MRSVFIIDDHPFVRLSIRILLEHEGYKIVGETDNGIDALQIVRECLPDLIILDIGIPKVDGLELLDRLNSLSPAPRTLVLTAQSAALFAGRCMQAGASGYVSKEQDLGELVGAIKAVSSGYNYFPSQALSPLRSEDGSNLELLLFRSLNNRELIALQLFAQGCSNKDIASSLFLSNKTVSTYKKKIMQKLNISTMSEMIDMAKRNALV
ncbi:response regulator transcription factor [Pseudomonas sp. MAFF 302030]|jgi:two-component system response regulator EvgA|uniref:Response regulator transcription factor n=1 Tax=Pseudomonas morbosilactucae TaxID=2938197 RepID=A0A9X1YY31_9PSED|nr:response regulator transcription factor [Pseudomonas morbosilactucae]MCK9800232.1 response regulator transcription factor [Pseudomonas morbosilactucae]WEK08495.1 MAG: response regulator transcription factor [Pseudomonas sp.]